MPYAQNALVLWIHAQSVTHPEQPHTSGTTPAMKVAIMDSGEMEKIVLLAMTLVLIVQEQAAINVSLVTRQMVRLPFCTMMVVRQHVQSTIGKTPSQMNAKHAKRSVSDAQMMLKCVRNVYPAKSCMTPGVSRNVLWKHILTWTEHAQHVPAPVQSAKQLSQHVLNVLPTSTCTTPHVQTPAQQIQQSRQISLALIAHHLALPAPRLYLLVLLALTLTSFMEMFVCQNVRQTPL